jgi:hypothetical protein
MTCCSRRSSFITSSRCVECFSSGIVSDVTHALYIVMLRYVCTCAARGFCEQAIIVRWCGCRHCCSLHQGLVLNWCLCYTNTLQKSKSVKVGQRDSSRISGRLGLAENAYVNRQSGPVLRGMSTARILCCVSRYVRSSFCAARSMRPYLSACLCVPAMLMMGACCRWLKPIC